MYFKNFLVAFLAVALVSQARASDSILFGPLAARTEPESAVFRQRFQATERQSYVYDYIASVTHSMADSGYRPKFGKSGNQGYGVGVAVLDGLTNCTTGLITNCNNIRFTGGTYNYYDDHGTHVAGLIAGKSGTLLTGMANQSSIYNYAIFDDYGYLSDSAVTTAINDAVNNFGVKVVNLSFGLSGVPGSIVSADSVSFITQSNYVKKILAIQAAGNDGVNLLSINSRTLALNYSKLKNIIMVGAIDEDGNIASFSNRPGGACFKDGAKACVEQAKLKYFFMVAPGQNAVSIYADGNLGYMTGTSMAAPIVSGAAALILGRWPTLTPVQVRDILFKSADDLGKTGVDGIYGQGALNIGKAMSPIGGTTARSSSGSSLKVSNSSFIKGGSFAQGISASPAIFDNFGRDFSMLQLKSLSFKEVPVRKDFSASGGNWRGTLMVDLERGNQFNPDSSGFKFLGLRISDDGFTFHSGVRQVGDPIMYRSERSDILKPYFFDYKLVGISSKAGNIVASAQQPADTASSSSAAIFFEPGAIPLTFGLIKEASGFYGLSSSENLGFSAPSNSIYVGTESALTEKSSIRAETLYKPQGARGDLVSYRSAAVVGGAYSQTTQNVGKLTFAASKIFFQDYRSNLAGFQAADISPLEISVSLKNSHLNKITSDVFLKTFSNGLHKVGFSFNSRF